MKSSFLSYDWTEILQNYKKAGIFFADSVKMLKNQQWFPALCHVLPCAMQNPQQFVTLGNVYKWCAITAVSRCLYPSHIQFALHCCEDLPGLFYKEQKNYELVRPTKAWLILKYAPFPFQTSDNAACFWKIENIVFSHYPHVVHKGRDLKPCLEKPKVGTLSIDTLRRRCENILTLGQLWKVPSIR